jgi:exodeoxyribonuclease V gamma subunit
MSHDRFDLINSNKKPGDRIPAWEDRYVFLEALLCARQMFYLSYVGRDRKDDSEKQPSILVSELLDYLETRFQVKAGNYKNIRELVVTRERLQAFNQVYFSGQDPRLFSYSEVNCKAALASIHASLLTKVAPLDTSTVSDSEWDTRGAIKGHSASARWPISPPSDDSWKFVDLQDFIRFFLNPCKYFLNKRVGVVLSEPEEMREDSEDYEIHGLDEFLLKDELMRAKVDKSETNLSLENLCMAGKLPCGSAGRIQYDRLEQAASALAGQVRRLVQEKLESRKVMLGFDRGLTLSGSLRNASSSGIFHFRPVRTGYRDHLRLWISHLICCATRNGEAVSGIKSMFLGNEGTPLVFKGVERAEEILAGLIELYEQGQVSPVKFLPETSWTWYGEIHKGGDEDKARDRAMQVWYYRKSNFGGREPEVADPYMGRYYPGENDLDREFEQISEKVWKPAFEHKL